MKGLLLKDFMNIMRNKKLLILLLAFYVGLGFFMDSNVSVCGMTVFFLSYQLLTAFSFDEAGKWERFAMTMPLSRRQLVSSKYILMLLLIGLGFLLSCVMGGILNVIHPVEGEGFREIAVAAAGVSAAFLILFSLMMPFIFRLGMEKARLLLIICFALPGGLCRDQSGQEIFHPDAGRRGHKTSDFSGSRIPCGNYGGLLADFCEGIPKEGTVNQGFLVN